MQEQFPAIHVSTLLTPSETSRDAWSHKHSSIARRPQVRQGLRAITSRASSSRRNRSSERAIRSRRNCHFDTGHALPLTFVRFLRPRLGHGNHAKCPRNDHEKGSIHGPGRALNLGVSLPHPETRQDPVRTAAAAAPQTCPCPRSVRIHGLTIATIWLRTTNVLAQSKGSRRTGTGFELIRASERSCPTGEIIQAAFSPRSRQSSHKEANDYVLI